jgi:hypothetical protein
MYIPLVVISIVEVFLNILFTYCRKRQKVRRTSLGDGNRGYIMNALQQKSIAILFDVDSLSLAAIANAAIPLAKTSAIDPISAITSSDYREPYTIKKVIDR